MLSGSRFASEIRIWSRTARSAERVPDGCPHRSVPAAADPCKRTTRRNPQAAHGFRNRPVKDGMSVPQHFPEIEDDGRKDDQEYRWKDEDHERKKELYRRLLGQGFRPVSLA